MTDLRHCPTETCVHTTLPAFDGVLFSSDVCTPRKHLHKIVKNKNKFFDIFTI